MRGGCILEDGGMCFCIYTDRGKPMNGHHFYKAVERHIIKLGAIAISFTGAGLIRANLNTIMGITITKLKDSKICNDNDLFVLSYLSRTQCGDSNRKNKSHE